MFSTVTTAKFCQKFNKLSLSPYIIHIHIVVKFQRFQRVQRKDIFTYFDLSHFGKNYYEKKICSTALFIFVEIWSNFQRSLIEFFFQNFFKKFNISWKIFKISVFKKICLFVMFQRNWAALVEIGSKILNAVRQVYQNVTNNPGN